MSKRDDDGLSPELKKLWPDLVDYALECLNFYCRADKPRLHKTAKAYVKRAIATLSTKPAWDALEDWLQTKICDLVNEDEVRTWTLIAETDWEQVTPAAIASLVKSYGTQQVLDKEMTDWVQEAITQLIERGRHFPHERRKPVQVLAWIYNTVRSNISHARRDAAKLPPHLSIVAGSNSDDTRGECSEEHLPAAKEDPDDDEDEDDDADHRRRPASAPSLTPRIPANAPLRPFAR